MLAQKSFIKHQLIQTVNASTCNLSNAPTKHILIKKSPPDNTKVVRWARLDFQIHSELVIRGQKSPSRHSTLLNVSKFFGTRTQVLLSQA